MQEICANTYKSLSFPKANYGDIEVLDCRIDKSNMTVKKCGDGYFYMHDLFIVLTVKVEDSLKFVALGVDPDKRIAIDANPKLWLDPHNLWQRFGFVKIWVELEGLYCMCAEQLRSRYVQ